MPKLLLVLLLTAVAPASAQTFRLTDPALTLDGRRVGVAGAPLVQELFGVLSIDVPSTGVYQISAQPFEGARAAGQFDGDGLYFSVDGRSVRLRSAGPILGGSGPTTAFVRFDALPPGLSTRGLVRVSVSGAPQTTQDSGRSSAPPASPPAASQRSGETLGAETSRLRRQVADVQAERDALRLQLNVMEHERDALRASVERLTAGLADERLEDAPLNTSTEAPYGVSMPGFELGRLRNAGRVQQRLAEAQIAASAAGAGIRGDVLVLFETDRAGRVIRTAVPSPLGGGLDGLAEALVREMVFVPPTVGGRPTGLRSQVTVRFRG